MRFISIDAPPASLGGTAPQLLESSLAPAAGLVVLVAHRVALVVILVILLGGPEFAGRRDRRDDRLLERLGLLERRFRRLRRLALRVVVHEDLASILAAAVAE